MRGISPGTSDADSSVRHAWVNTIVWLNSTENQTVVGITYSQGGAGYAFQTSLDKYMDDTHPKMVYYKDDSMDGFHTINATETAGDFHDLIDWTQLTAKARKGLEKGDFGQYTPVRFNDGNFKNSIVMGSIDGVLAYKQWVEKDSLAYM
ncbi:unnamed protein product [Phytophthora fragariaefolia]|uniref:Unnamed protein product n=1 Tax=Phytophthora fragariaefolia TaxID=1490495 RepID=A0A9W6XV14_9STRA|nr:unnamed protein product [Phytophthora fragariaefolia]